MHPTWRHVLLSLALQALSISDAAAMPARSDMGARDVDGPSTYAADASGPPGGYRNIGYFTNWGIYGRNFQPADLAADKYTHILYSFANLKKDTGEVYLSDTYADLDKHYPSDSWSDTGNNAYGCTKQFYMLKQKHRNLKVMLSIGGYTYSPSFSGAASTDANRKNFAQTSVKLLKDMGFDGLDVDWEYPASDDDKKNYVLLLTEMRNQLDAYAATVPGKPHFLLSIASPAGPQNFPYFDWKGMDAQLDYWNLMAYDYAGSFSDMSGYQDNLFNSTKYAAGAPFNTDTAVQAYIDGGVTANKINLGMPLYGRAFVGTSGPGQKYSGVGAGSWENGIWDYKALPKDGATVNTDSEAGAIWSYDNSSQTMITYDDPSMTMKKIDYIKKNGLGGGMWWEVSGDYPVTDPKSLVGTFTSNIGTMEKSDNTLAYPDSQYDNIKNGLKASAASAAGSTNQTFVASSNAPSSTPTGESRFA